MSFRHALISGLALAATLGCEDKPAASKATTPPAAGPTAEAVPSADAPAARAKPATAEPPLDLTKPETLKLQAPPTFEVKFQTTKGDFVVTVHRDWAPNGGDRLYNLVKAGYFKDIAFFRVIQGFMAQFGISGDPTLNQIWHAARIQDDPIRQTNSKGRLTFATAGPNTRTTQIFISLVNNARLDKGFAPIGEVTKGMEVVEALYSGYGEGQPGGRGPAQNRLQTEGNAYLKAEFPELDYIKLATVL
jgi:peptidyl-prolyl cis-trans isomerase A (cyclophilin A)